MGHTGTGPHGSSNDEHLDIEGIRIADLEATIAEWRVHLQRILDVCDVTTKAHMSYTSDRYLDWMREAIETDVGTHLLDRLKELNALVTPGLYFWESAATERAAENAELRRQLDAKTDELRRRDVALQDAIKQAEAVGQRAAANWIRGLS